MRDPVSCADNELVSSPCRQRLKQLLRKHCCARSTAPKRSTKNSPLNCNVTPEGSKNKAGESWSRWEKMRNIMCGGRKWCDERRRWRDQTLNQRKNMKPVQTENQSREFDKKCFSERFHFPSTIFSISICVRAEYFDRKQKPGAPRVTCAIMWNVKSSKICGKSYKLHVKYWKMQMRGDLRAVLCGLCLQAVAWTTQRGQRSILDSMDSWLYRTWCRNALKACFFFDFPVWKS